MMRRLLLLVCVAVLTWAASPVRAASDLVLVVMDPMALELSCPCVKGYAQRNYSKLAAHLTKQLGREVKLHFADNLATALKVKTGGRADLVIGKDSVVEAGAAANKLAISRLVSLTDKQGKTTQTGLWVVAAKDPALSVADLQGYDLIFGLADAAEKHAAALNLLDDFGIKAPAKRNTCGSCSDAARKLLDEHQAGRKAAAVISSYAQPLLEGCGTIQKGDLRVIGTTAEVPFVTAFVRSDLPAAESAAIKKALLEVAKDAALCKLLETKQGFVGLPAGAAKKK
ncbi:MAG: PhnD/SsuA/transferrin family substrate-binding protein [Gemmataceae bacterium]